MDEATFWRIIETAKVESKGECYQQVRLSEQQLAQLPPEEIQSFDRLLSRFVGAADNHHLRAAAYLINGGGSEDGFMDFRGWLIAQGEAIFYSVLQNPDSLANLVEPTEEEVYKYTCEHMLYIAWRAYESNTGQEMPQEETSASEITKEPEKEDTLAEQESPWGADRYLKEEYARKHLPKLWAKFGWLIWTL
ncbi:MAG TPA: DUF4240 domain-containing protein [Ktedonobacterales bacterium]|jgi:hypothetical protein